MLRLSHHPQWTDYSKGSYWKINVKNRGGEKVSRKLNRWNYWRWKRMNLSRKKRLWHLCWGRVEQYAVTSINKGLCVQQTSADQGIWSCSKSCCVHLPTSLTSQTLHHLQTLKLLSSGRRRSIWHSKGQRSLSSGKVTDIITSYLTFKQFTSHLPYTYLRYFLYSTAPVWQWRLLIRRSGTAGRCNVALCTLSLDLTYGSGYATAVCLLLTFEPE